LAIFIARPQWAAEPADRFIVPLTLSQPLKRGFERTAIGSILCCALCK